jgi:glucose/arabinose dehydrogenase
LHASAREGEVIDMTRFSALLIGLLLAGGVPFLTAGDGLLTATGEPVALTTGANPALQAVASGFDLPVGVVSPRDGSRRLFIVQQRGSVAIFDGRQRLTQLFLDIRPEVLCCGERGLLGLAFHPRYQENGFFYVNYTNRGGDTVIERYQRNPADPNRADPSTGRTILTIPQPFGNHNAGHLAFGPDGYLYIATGDGGSGGDPQNLAQNLSTHLGKVLRIDVDSAEPYAIPPDNPFLDRGEVRPEIWAYGLRNPWRYSFDRDTGDLWIGDVGQSAREEINFQPASSRGGENYGWPMTEGSLCFRPATNCNDGTLVLPVLEYPLGQGNCAVVAGFRYRGWRFPRMFGMFFYGDYCSGTLRGAIADEGGFTQIVAVNTGTSLTSFGEDEQGELWAVSHTGTVYRLIDEGFESRKRPARRGGVN